MQSVGIENSVRVLRGQQPIELTEEGEDDAAVLAAPPQLPVQD